MGMNSQKRIENAIKRLNGEEIKPREYKEIPESSMKAKPWRESSTAKIKADGIRNGVSSFNSSGRIVQQEGEIGRQIEEILRRGMPWKGGGMPLKLYGVLPALTAAGGSMLVGRNAEAAGLVTQGMMNGQVAQDYLIGKAMNGLGKAYEDPEEYMRWRMEQPE